MTIAGRNVAKRRPGVETSVVCRHADRPRRARDLCGACYRMHQLRTNSVRALCHPDKPHYANGLCYACGQAAYRAKCRKNNPGEAARRERITVYGIFAAQEYEKTNNCEACGDQVSGRHKHVDHDHEIKDKEQAFRGILCHYCNSALGFLKEDSGRALLLAHYINQRCR